MQISPLSTMVLRMRYIYFLSFYFEVIIDFIQFSLTVTSYKAAVQYRNWQSDMVHCCYPELTQFSPSFLTYIRVCVCVSLCSFIQGKDLSNCHHNQDSELFHRHGRTPLCSLFVSAPPPASPYSLASTDLFSMSTVLSFKESYIDGITHIIYWA